MKNIGDKVLYYLNIILNPSGDFDKNHKLIKATKLKAFKISKFIYIFL